MGCCGSVNSSDLGEYSAISSVDKTIEKYITEDCEFRRKNGSSIDIVKQLEKQRIEIICMGCFLFKNKKLIDEGKIKVLIRDKAIDGTKYRPDLIFERSGKIYHVEIDENKHDEYDKEKEKERYEVIKNYCLTNFGSYNLIRFNPNVHDKRFVGVDSKLNIAEEFNYLLSGIDGLLMFERN